MDSLVVDLTLHRLSNIVFDCLKELETPNKQQSTRDVSIRINNLYEIGEITRIDYLFLQSRVLLNEFCYKMEDLIGNGVVCGFTFYSKERHKLYFGAGANYPCILKDFLHERTPTVCMESMEQYGDDEIFALNRLDDWPNDRECYVSVFKLTDRKSIISKRLRLNDITFGTFECYFPYEDGPTEEIMALIRKEVKPLKEELFHIREEMLEALTTLPKSIVIPKPKVKIPTESFRLMAVSLVGLKLFSGMFPLAGKLIEII